MATNPATPIDYTSQVNDLYQKELNRPGDTGGMDFYKNNLANGSATLDSVDQALKNSEEYKSLHSSTGLLNPANGPTAVAAPPPITPPQAVNASAVNATATTYDPTKQVLSGASSVQNQLANITSSGSQLNTLAAADATKQANRRGLLNSSIAVGAGQKAVLQSALPIAQQDASTNASTDAANAQFENSASQFNASAKNSTSQLNAQLGTNVNVTNAAAQNTSNLQTALAQIQANTSLSVADKQIKSQQLIAQNNNQTNLTIAGNDNATKTLLQTMDASSKLSLAGIDANTKMALANLDATTKTNLQTLQQNNQQLLQTNISASNMFTQYMTNLANISTSDKMDAAAKQAAADNQLAALNAQLQAIGQISGLDLSKHFQSATPITPPVSTTPAADAAANIPAVSGYGSDGGG